MQNLVNAISLLTEAHQVLQSLQFVEISEDTIKLRDTYYDKTGFGTEREYRHLPSIYTLSLNILNNHKAF